MLIYTKPDSDRGYYVKSIRFYVSKVLQNVPVFKFGVLAAYIDIEGNKISCCIFVIIIN